VRSKRELPIGAVPIRIFAHAVKRLHDAFLQSDRLHDAGLDLAAVEVETDLQVVLVIRKLGFERKHNRELGPLNDLYVRQGSLHVFTVGLVLVKSVTIDVDRHARSREVTCAHCGGDCKLLGRRRI
jgi:hypothetical protein